MNSFFAYNLPLQVRVSGEGSLSILNYMPRREALCWLDLDECLDGQSRAEFFEETARVLENLARLMRAVDGDADPFVYFPDEDMDPDAVNGAPIPSANVDEGGKVAAKRDDEP